MVSVKRVYITNADEPWGLRRGRLRKRSILELPLRRRRHGSRPALTRRECDKVMMTEAPIQ